MTRSRMLRLAICLACLVCATTVASAQARGRASVGAEEMSAALENTARAAAAAVVEIFTAGYAPADGVVTSADGLVRTQRGSGSGAIVDPTGYIVTNAHVVRGARRVRVEIPSVIDGTSILPVRGRVVPAEVIGIDLETDLAVIKVEAGTLPSLAFGDSDRLRPGQLVLALGSPLGFHNSVSFGVVSSVARQLEPESAMVYVQTDAAISPGSSGGPLMDLGGRIVGINTLAVSASSGGERLGFSAPSNIVRSVYEQIRATGRVHRGDIGIRPQTATPTIAAGLGLARDRGAVLADVLPHSPAALAGLQPGDLVVALDGRPMENGRQLQVGLYRRFVGDIVSLELFRDGEPLRVTVVVAERFGALAGATGSQDPREHLVPRLGVLGLTVSPQVAAAVEPLRAPAGVLVMSVAEAAFDTRQGRLAAGDVIHAVNRAWVADLEELRRAIDGVKVGDPVVLQVERQGELRYVAFVVEE